jgi:hypothetical protein
MRRERRGSLVRRAWHVALAGAAAVLVSVSCGPNPAVGFGGLSVTGVSPSAGSLPAGALVTLTGTGFVALGSGAAVQVSVCGVALTDVEVVGQPVRVGLPGGAVVDAVVGSTLSGVASAPLVVGAVEVVRVDGVRAVWAAEASCKEPEPTAPPVAAHDAPAGDSAPGDPFHAPLTPMAGGAAWTLAAPGLLANDDLGGVGAVVAFGGGDLGGTVEDHAAGATVTVLGHRLRVDADGGVEFVPAPGFTGTFQFAYALGNALGRSTAEVVIAVGVRPSAGAALDYPHVLIGNVGIDTGRSTFATVPLVGDALVVSVTGSSGGTASVRCAEGATRCTFAFEPDAGFTGDAWFEVEASNGFGAAGPVRVTLEVEGRVWFVDAAAAPGGDGTLAAPFDCLRSVGCAANGVLGVGDAVFVASGAYGDSSGIDWRLPADARLIGAGATAALPELLDRLWPADATPAPATGGASPVLDASMPDGRRLPHMWVWLGTDNLLAGITLAGTANAAILGWNFGTLTVHDVTVERSGTAVDLWNGSVQGGFASVSNDGLESFGIHLVQVETLGTFSFGAGALRSTNPPLSILGGSGDFEFDGDLTTEVAAAATGFAVRVDGMTGGSVTLRGAVAVVSYASNAGTGSAGVLVTNQTGAAKVRLDGATVSAGVGTAVRLSGNAAGTSVVFEGGASIAATGSARGLHATDGGAVGGTLRSVTSQTGIAVDLDGVSIDATGLTIEALNAGTSAGGPASALRVGMVDAPGALRVLGGMVRRATGNAVQLAGTSAVVEIAGLDVGLDVCFGLGSLCTGVGVAAFDVVDVTVRDGRFTGGRTGLVATFSPSADGTAVSFLDNVVGSTAGPAIAVFSDGGSENGRSSAATVSGNEIGGAGTPVEGVGIAVRHMGGVGGGAMLRVVVSNNAIVSDGRGIGLDMVSGEARVDATLVGNSVTSREDAVAASIATSQSLCFDLRNTRVMDGGVGLQNTSLGEQFLPGYAGAPRDSDAVLGFVLSQNTLLHVSLQMTDPSSPGFQGGPPCALP